LRQLDEILAIFEVYQRQPDSEIAVLLNRCKQAGRSIKMLNRVDLPVFSDISVYVPDREIADQFVQAYLRTFESIFRVLAVQLFLEEYEAFWINPGAADQTFVIKLLLMMAIGSVVQPIIEGMHVHEPAVQWIYVAHSWLNTPFEKLQMTLEGIQIHCLLLIARQACDVEGDHVWLSAGTLLRKAMHIGLHIDPETQDPLPKSSQQVQLHRMLWATVVELVLQSSMDAGGLPLLTAADYDTKQPRNVSQMLLDEQIDTSLQHYSQSSLQIHLVRTQPVRLEIAAFINDFRPESTSYEKTIQLSEKLSVLLASNAALLTGYEKHPHPPTTFQIKLLQTLTHRFVLALHYPWAVKAKTDRTFYYSRKIGLETSLLLLSYKQATLDCWDEFCRIRTLGGALHKAVPFLATMFVREELVDQLENEKHFDMTINQQSRRELRKALKDYVDLTAVRVQYGQTNVKAHVSCMLLPQSTRYSENSRSWLLDFSAMSTLCRTAPTLSLLYRQR
jgi:hypothetical protein